MRKYLTRIIAAFVLASALQLASGTAFAAPSAEACQADKASPQIEGANFIAGSWRVTGTYDDGGNVNFVITFAADGSFVDSDNFPGRWLISGSNVSVYYPDESWLGYVGAIEGDTITGGFRGSDNSGQFQMSRY
jgi:hypothetical protein